jgi:hypothetical protein
MIHAGGNNGDFICQCPESVTICHTKVVVAMLAHQMLVDSVHKSTVKLSSYSRNALTINESIPMSIRSDVNIPANSMEEESCPVTGGSVWPISPFRNKETRE